MTQKNVAMVERYSCSECLAIFRSGYARCPLCGASVEVLTSGDPLVGRTLDRYKIERCVGEGGMGRVYLASHVYTGKQHAIKVLFGDHAADPKMRQRMMQEARAVGRLSHRNVIAITDAAETEDNSFYLIMDFVDGENLATLIAREAPFSQERVLNLMKQLCMGLGHAHDNGLVHRDFKSENVLVANDADGELAKIVDFGIAVVLEAAQSGHKLTTEGMVLGTPAFMAPEQATGAKVDHRSDLFSLGVLMYEMLSGKLPFDGSPLDIARQNLVAEPPRLAQRVPGLIVDPRLEDVVFGLMAKRPEDRYQSAHDVLRALDGISSGLVRASSSAEGAPYGSTEMPTLRPNSAIVRPTTNEGTEPSERVVRYGYETGDRFGGVTGEGGALPRVTNLEHSGGVAVPTAPPRRSNTGLLVAILISILGVGGAFAYYQFGRGKQVASNEGAVPPGGDEQATDPAGIQPEGDDDKDNAGTGDAKNQPDDKGTDTAAGQGGDTPETDDKPTEGGETKANGGDGEGEGGDKSNDSQTTDKPTKSDAELRRERRAIEERRRRQLTERKLREQREAQRQLEEKRRREREEAAERKRQQEEAAKKAAAAKSDNFESYQRLYRQVGQLLDRAGLPPSHSLVRDYLDINYQSGIMNASLRSKYITRLKGIRYQVGKLKK